MLWVAIQWTRAIFQATFQAACRAIFSPIGIRNRSKRGPKRTKLEDYAWVPFKWHFGPVFGQIIGANFHVGKNLLNCHPVSRRDSLIAIARAMGEWGKRRKEEGGKGRFFVGWFVRWFGLPTIYGDVELERLQS